MKRCLILILSAALLLCGCGGVHSEELLPETISSTPAVTEFSAEEAQLLLKQEAQVLNDKYGVTILVGDQCYPVYSHFTASVTTDYDQVSAALDFLDYILGRYPEGFFRQLCGGERKSIQMHLVCDLYANNGDLQGDGYGGFSQDMLDHYLMVLDVEDLYEELFYHEFSHIIDNHLTWDAANRKDALFSEEKWNAHNPAWFTGYSYNYTELPELLEDGWFVDSYAAVNPSEDRAQVMAKAMMPNYRIYFKNNQGIREKMIYYSLCIQDAFDTTGWPEVLPWEESFHQQ